MKKDHIKDYATHAFEEYSRRGCPTRKECEEKIRGNVMKSMFGKDPKVIATTADHVVKNMEPLLKDIDAAISTLEELERKNKGYISGAVRAVYFVNANENLNLRIIRSRVLMYSMTIHADERTVYRWLQEARALFAVKRGMNIVEKQDDFTDRWIDSSIVGSNDKV